MSSVHESQNKSATQTASPQRPQLLKWRMALLMFLAVYPLVTIILYALVPLTMGWTIWQRSFILVPIMVGCIVFGVVPFIHAKFSQFIFKKPS